MICRWRKLRKTTALPAREPVFRAYQSVAEKLLDMEDRLGLHKRFRAMQESFAAIRQAAGDIRRYNDRHIHSRDIADALARIERQADKLEE